jgi:hypothetical protein
MALNEGASIRPRPGVVADFDFPVVVASEMDGQAEYVDADTRKPGQNAKIKLIAPDGRIEKSVSAAYDGYWSISSIRPGVYYLTAESDNSEYSGVVVPKMVEFKPSGSNAFGQSLVFSSGPSVGLRFASEQPPSAGKSRVRVQKRQDIAGQDIQLEVGDFYSRTAVFITWFNLKLSGGLSGGHYKLLTPLSKITPDAKTTQMRLTLKTDEPLDLPQAISECQHLEDRGFKCTVAVITRYKDLEGASS